MESRDVFITRQDKKRLYDAIQEVEDHVDRGPVDFKGLRKLLDELERATMIDPAEMPPDVVTMNTKVLLRDQEADEEMTYTLVFPEDADIDKGAISVLAPIGMAILGYREGDVIEWTVPSGVRHITIEKILYQPEAAGDYDR